jgi:hypothetical protein
MIIYKATQFSRSKKPTTPDEIKRSKKRNEIIVFITFFYVAVELPPNIMIGYFFKPIMALGPIGAVINALFNKIQFSYPAFNIFILYFSNKLFAKEVKLLFQNLNSNLKSGQTKTTQASSSQRNIN